MLKIVYILILVIFGLIAYAVLQIKLFGLNVKDFWSFVEANQTLDRLYAFAKKYDKMSQQQQLIYLKQAEEVFKAFDKVPTELWEEEYDKYNTILQKYNDIKVLRWVSS